MIRIAITLSGYGSEQLAAKCHAIDLVLYARHRALDVQLAAIFSGTVVAGKFEDDIAERLVLFLPNSAAVHRAWKRS